jgi:anti-sigma factor RsiW
LRAKAEHYRAMNQTLREQLDAELEIPVPPALTHAALHRPAPLAGTAPAPDAAPRVRSAANSGRFAQAAALLVAVAIGVAAGWGARGTRDATSLAARSATPVSIPLIRAATVAHAAYTPEVRHPVEVGAGEQAHLVAWLSKRLGTPLKVPVLEAQGYRLVGGRLLPDAGRGVAAQFMFESAQGLRLTLFVRSDQGSDDTAFRYASSQGLSTFYWLDRGYGYALSGALPREAMLAVATEVYRQINP